MKLLIIDDHEVVREGLRVALERDDFIEVVGEASTGEEALTAVSELRPDVALTDYRLPDMTGDALCRAILAAQPETRVVVLTTFLNEELVRSCMASGATAFVTKASGIEELRDTLRQIEHGEIVEESVSSAVHRLFEHRRASQTLTPRQEHVLTLVADGLTYGEIATRLSISQSTVRFHVQGLKDRLGARSKADLIAIAVRDALILPPVAPL